MFESELIGTMSKNEIANNIMIFFYQPIVYN